MLIEKDTLSSKYIDAERPRALPAETMNAGEKCFMLLQIIMYEILTNLNDLRNFQDQRSGDDADPDQLGECDLQAIRIWFG